MGARHSSSPSLSAITEDQAVILPSSKFYSYSLNFPRLVTGRRCSQNGNQMKFKGKRNVSATFNINDYESAYESQESNPQSCVSSLSSNQNFFSSNTSMTNAPAHEAKPRTVGDLDGCPSARSVISWEFDRENMLLNINAATEEGFMTLPGVTRPTARNIVNYRKLIGGFKNIQDIALVSGVGATLYVRFRSDIMCPHDLPTEVVQGHPQVATTSGGSSNPNSDQRLKSCTPSKHSSTSSSGIDISTVAEEDEEKVAYHHHHYHPHQHPNKTSGSDNCHSNANSGAFTKTSKSASVNH